MTAKKSEAAEGDKMIETKSKSGSVKSQKRKPAVEKEVKSLKEEDLLLESGTDSDYDGDVISSALRILLLLLS